MSRSFRKPYIVDGYGTKQKKISKRQASRAVRSEKEVPNGNTYKKVYCPWNIADYRFHDPKSKKAYRK